MKLRRTSIFLGLGVSFFQALVMQPPAGTCKFCDFFIIIWTSCSCMRAVFAFSLSIKVINRVKTFTSISVQILSECFETLFSDTYTIHKRKIHGTKNNPNRTKTIREFWHSMYALFKYVYIKIWKWNVYYYEWSIRQEPRLHSTFFNFRSTNSSGVLSLSENQRNI
jgi:hypothetical protein